MHHPELRGKPVAVGGDPEARQVCPEIIFLPPRMDLYLRFSRMANEIYNEYSDLVESFGIDENWIDVSAMTSIKGDGYKIATEISNRVKSELGISSASVCHLTRFMRSLVQIIRSRMLLQLCTGMRFNRKHGAYLHRICYMWEGPQMRNSKRLVFVPLEIWQGRTSRY